MLVMQIRAQGVCCLGVVILALVLATWGNAFAAPDTESPIGAYSEAVATGDADDIASAGDALIEKGAAGLGLTAVQFFEIALEIAAERAQAGDLDAALLRYDFAIEYANKSLPTERFALRDALIDRAAVRLRSGDAAGAEADARAALAIAEAELGPENPALRTDLRLLSAALEAVGRDEAERRTVQSRIADLTEKALLQQGEIVAMSGGPRDVDQCRDATRKDRAFQRVKTFFGTHRTPSGEDTPNRVFQNIYDEASDIHYGLAYVSVPCNRDLGSIPTAAWWKGSFRPNKAKHVVFEDVRSISSAQAFWQTASSTIDRSTRKEALVFIHGFNVDFAGAALQTAQLAVDLEIDGVPFFWDWPSHASMFRYGPDRDLVGPALFKSLAAFLYSVVEETGAEVVHVVAHSMGNEFLLGALGELSDNAYRTSEAPPFESIVFASPDVRVGDFRAGVTDIISLAERLTLYASRRDWALAVSAFMAKMRRAGDAQERVIVDGVDLIDTTNAPGGVLSVLGVRHSDFASSSGLDDLRSVLWLGLPPRLRCVLSEMKEDNKSFWAFASTCEDVVFQATVIGLRRWGYETAIAKAEEQIGLTDGNTEENIARWKAVLEQLRRIGE